MIDDWIEIGKIVSPQGMKGEMRVYPETDFPERFEVPGKRWLLRANATEPEEVELVKGRFLEGKNLYVIQLRGVKYRDEAEQLRGCKLVVPESDRPQLGEDEYHLMDLVGLPVFMQDDGKLIGTVVDLINAGNDLLEVRLGSEEEGDKGTRGQGDGKKIQKPKNILIPFVKAIVPVVDLEAGRIEITPPVGLLEIN
ncbi:ribosome maturation factor RimM [Calothrix sp. CCY 0018]|uniref:ribosome maturation factor RimM n=1 Tax=Calothrix sp. CCY 0018 TaxID=3103864 RepID=UPI0039C60489